MIVPVSANPGHSLPAGRRLRGRGDFSRAFAGQRVSGRHFAVYGVLVSGARARSRIGLVVSKRITRTNVRRNAVKRLIRETFRVSAAAMKPLDVVVRLKAAIGEREMDDARRELDRLFERMCRAKPAEVADPGLPDSR